LNHLLDNCPSHIPPLFKIPFPDGTLRYNREIRRWITLSSWYFGSWESVYFDLFSTDSKIQRFKLIIKPDLSDASLHFINMSEITSNDLKTAIAALWLSDSYRICEDALVIFCDHYKKGGVFTGLTSAPFTNVVTPWKFKRARSLCPTSGRFVYCAYVDDVRDYLSERIVVVDLL
jgi:hypothetical protein